jgi:uncharacterized membrane protein
MRLIRLLKNDLAQEVAEWQADGLISASQAERICARYGIDFNARDAHSFGYRLLIALGYLFVGLAVITLLSANWDEIPRMLRIGMLVALTLGVNLFGLQRYRQGEDNAATAAFFLGALLYGASIMLIAQIYHLGEHYPDGIYWWMIGTLPMALLLKSRLLMLLVSALAIVWFLVETEMGYLPRTFPLFLLALAWFVFYAKASNLLFLVLMASVLLWSMYLLGWYTGSAGHFDLDAPRLTFGVGYLVLCFAISNWLASRSAPHLREYGLLLDLWSLRLGVLVLLVFSFDMAWWEYIGWARQSPLLHGTIILLCSALALILHHLSGSRRRNAVVAAVSYLALFLPALSWGEKEHTIIFQLIDNLLLIGFGIWLIVHGISQATSHYFYLGVGTVLVTGLVRYMDLVGDYLGASLLFLLFAVILLFSARYWRVRNAGRGAGR